MKLLHRIALVLLGAVLAFAAAPATNAAAEPTEHHTAAGTMYAAASGNFVFTRDSTMSQNVAACSYTASRYYACLVMQGDGNLVLYDSRNADPENWRFGRAMWDTNTNNRGRWMHFQTDGNFVVYRGVSDPVWAARSQPGYTLQVQTDGNLVVYNRAGAPLWATNTTF